MINKRSFIGGFLSTRAFTFFIRHHNDTSRDIISILDLGSQDLISLRTVRNLRCMERDRGYNVADGSASENWNLRYLDVLDENDGIHRIAYHFFDSHSEISDRDPTCGQSPRAYDGFNKFPVTRKADMTTTIIFLPGLMSSMKGTKSKALLEYCLRRSHSYLCFDYRGHGESDGRFEECNIHDWMNDSRSIINLAVSKRHNGEGKGSINTSNEKSTSPNIILVGSSMGAWIALNLALEFSHLISAVIGIGSAIDFTRHMYQTNLTNEQRALWTEEQTNSRRSEDEFVMLSSPYLEDPFPLTRHLYESGKTYLLSQDRNYEHTSNKKLKCAVRLLHGDNDEIVPLSKVIDDAFLLRTKYECNDVRVTEILDGDHRLSRNEDVTVLLQTLDDILSI